MNNNVIAFTPLRAIRPALGKRPATGTGNNVIELAGWLGRALPRRTPNGVFFTTHVLVTPGGCA